MARTALHTLRNLLDQDTNVFLPRVDETEGLYTANTSIFYHNGLPSCVHTVKDLPSRIEEHLGRLLG